MKLRERLLAIARAVADEAAQNAEFEAKLLEALSWSAEATAGGRPKAAPAKVRERATSDRPRGKNRRPPAVLDPVDLVTEGESRLRAALAELSLERLRDIVADYGMDPGKLVLKWKDSQRVVDRIVELSMSRSQKGSAFKADQ